MAELVKFNVRYKKIIKNYGVTKATQEELFEGKYDEKQIYSATLWADQDCEFIGNSSGSLSSIKVKANQSVSLDNIRPWSSLKIKASVGTNYDILLGM